MTGNRVHGVRVAAERAFARMGDMGGVRVTGPFAFRGKKGCTGKNEDDDPGGKKPNKNKDEITKPECK
jgi:hypothetical protein